MKAVPPVEQQDRSPGSNINGANAGEGGQKKLIGRLAVAKIATANDRVSHVATSQEAHMLYKLLLSW